MKKNDSMVTDSSLDSPSPVKSSTLKRSPTKRLSKLGALYNPNNHNPYSVVVEPGLD